jgi:hypothetical protein
MFMGCRWTVDKPRLLTNCPLPCARQHVWDLIERQKAAPLAADEKSELDHYLEIEHLMRLAKARARKLLAHGL